MTVITINEADIKAVIEILQRGAYKRISYEYIQGLQRTKSVIKIADKTIQFSPAPDDPATLFYSIHSGLTDGELFETATKDNSWKFQISIDDSITEQSPNKENLAKAWNRVKEILLHHGVVSFKVVNKQALSDDKRKNYEKGKQITIYTTTSRGLNWADILRDITIALLLEPSIQPSIMSTSNNCRQMIGNRFISYRNDFNLDNKDNPITDKDTLKYPPEQRYNPFGFPDPFNGITFDITKEARQLLSQDSTQQQVKQIDTNLAQILQPAQIASSSTSSSSSVTIPIAPPPATHTPPPKDDEDGCCGCCPFHW